MIEVTLFNKAYYRLFASWDKAESSNTLELRIDLLGEAIRQARKERNF